MKQFCFFLMIFIVSCVTVYDTVSNRNWASMYSPGAQYLHPEFKIYHYNDSVSRIYIKIIPSELLYFPYKSYTEAKIRIYYHTTTTFSATQIIDSASSVFNLRNQSVDNRFITYMQVPVPIGVKRAIEIRISDINRGVTQSAALIIDKSGSITEQDFLLQNDDFSPVFQSFVHPERQYKITTRFGLKYLYIKYFNHHFEYPKPPFEIVDEDILLTPDTIVRLLVSDTLKVQFKHTGLYLVCPDSATKKGLPVVNFGVDYPRVRSAAALLEPLYYLTSKKEFKKLSESENIKNAVDTFWLKASPDAANARRLIMNYYNRVQLANFYFCSYTHGWSTDRGMIYIVYGAPTSVFRTDTSERWIYSRKSGTDALDFLFVKNSNPYSNNDFTLIRSKVYEAGWFRAVNTWRAGLIFSIADEPDKKTD